MSNITLQCGAITHQVNFITFSDGSETCELGSPTFVTGQVWVNLSFQDVTRDLIRIGLVKDALDRLGKTAVSYKLNLQYMPQARADRVFSEGLPLPVKMFADIINTYKFTEVRIMDPHSDVTSALIKNVRVIPQAQLVYELVTSTSTNLSDYVLCAPDLGATKKAFDAMIRLGQTELIQAIKIRDTSTGDIVRCDVVGDAMKGRNVLIIDDIADGGASFKFLAQKLKEKGAKEVALFVTHGIFSKGLQPLSKDIDRIYCRNIVGNFINQQNISDYNAR